MSPAPDLHLVVPTARYRDSFLRALRAWRDEGLAWHLAVDVDAVERDFEAFVQTKRDEAHPADPNVSPKTQLWAIADGEVVRRVGILHRLTAAQRNASTEVTSGTTPRQRFEVGVSPARCCGKPCRSPDRSGSTRCG